MTNAKSNAVQRLLAAFLSMLMVLSIIPFSIVANASTTAHPDEVTVTVIDDETNEPIKGAKVSFTIYDNDADSEVIGGTDEPTDENGEVAVLDAVSSNISISEITVSHDDYETYSNEAYNQPIKSLDDNFVIKLTCKKIRDVEISGKTLTYNGEEQELVSVTEVEGDTVEYYLNGATDSVTEVPTATDAATYSVRVVVTREGKTPLDQTVETVINPADIEDIDIAPVTGLKYNETDQALVTLTGNFGEHDTVTWSVNGTDETLTTVPHRISVGSYTVKLTVDRGANYNKFEKTVNVDIALGEIDLGDLQIEAVNRTYDTTEKELLSVTKSSNYTLEYSDDNQVTWVKNDIPKATNAGEYVIYVKATKDGYAEKNTPAFPITVTISKAEQSFDFDEYDAMANDTNPEVIELKGTVPYGQAYDFSAKDVDALANGTITYEVIADGDAAEIAADGTLTVNRPGAITVIAKLSGNDNYNECVIKYYLDVTGAVSSNGEYIEFAETEKNFVIGTNSTISVQKATKKSIWITGKITYSIKDVESIAIDPTSGELTVTNIDQLVEDVRSGNNEIIVTAKKAATRRYGADEISYKVIVSFEKTPANPYALSAVDGANGWYKTKATVTPVDGYAIAQKASDSFETTTEFSNQGTDVRYVYLKNTATGGITDRIAVNIKIDSVNPTDLKIEFSELNLFQKIGQSLGFYNPTVTITFTAKDVTSGIDHFDWTYTPESGAAVTKDIAVSVNAETNVATATLTLPADQAEQMHGKISFTATDIASNEIGKKDDYVFIIDTIAPELSVKYQGEEPYTAQEDIYNGAHFFNSDVVVELTITEANFYSEDIDIRVSKDGEDYAYGNIAWSQRNTADENVGKFTLAGDGDFVVTVNAKDKSGNHMKQYTSETITVDTKAPVIGSVYDPENQTITLTITEHNFRASDITVAIEARDINKESVPVNDIQAYAQNEANWTSNGDRRTLVLESTGENKILVDAIYVLTINYADISNNGAKTEITESSLIDHTVPDVDKIKIEYSTSIVDTVLSAITLGFYNPSVEVTFTAYDDTAGVVEFDWYYDRQNEVSKVNLESDSGKLTVEPNDRSGDKAIAKLVLPLNQAEQLRGHISVKAKDDKGNVSDKKTDNDKVIIVDTIGPKMTVEYSTASNSVGTRTYYTGDVEGTLTVTEANFFAEDVRVSVSKDGEGAESAAVVWKDESTDVHIGKFTLSGDGDYIVYVEYKDRSDNLMTDENGNIICYTDGEASINKYKSHLITIDTIDPVIKVTYDDDKVAAVNTIVDRDGNNRKYYSDTKTATITITEHNFNADDVKWNIVAKDVAGNILAINDLHSKSSWSSKGDVHTLTITYPGDANYSFDMAYTDLAARKAVAPKTAYFTVDKTAPTNLTVDYSTSVLDTVFESLNFGFYNAKMTVTLTAEDPTSEVHSFLYSYLNAAGVSSVNAELINEAIQAADIEYSADRKTATVTFEIPKMVLGNDNQFNGTVEFTATDRAGNETDAHKETKRIVVDNIAPTAQVSYNEATNTVGDISYYNGNITATITVNEANFYANDVQVMVSKDGGAATAVTPTWKDNSVDVHVGTFTLTEDGDYIVTINYTDKSSNKMATYTSKQMTVDTKIEAPTYTINGAAKTEIGGAYKGDATIGFNFNDQNFDTKNITLTRTRFDKVEDVTAEFVKMNDNNKGGSGSFSIPSEVSNDGIYVLKISMTDKAKQQTESQVKFTINRFGSVYEYSDKLVELIKNGGQYVTSVNDDLVITEYNADRILEGSLKILITRDGESVDVDFTSNPQIINAQVGIGESGWYQYVYTIKASNFEKDGVYKITLASKYATDDSDENESASMPDNSIDGDGKEIVDTMNFTVDSVAPEIRNIVNMDKKIADRDKIVDGKLNVKYTVVDVGGLKSIEIIVNGKTIQTITEKEIADNAYNFTGSFDIDEQDSATAQTVRIKVTDLAGNVSDTDSSEFLKNHSEDNADSTFIFHKEITVSRNFFVRWYANSVLFWGSIIGVIALVAAVWFLVAAKKKKRKEK